MKSASVMNKIILGLICLSAFAVPSTNMLPEVAERYEKEAYLAITDPVAASAATPEAPPPSKAPTPAPKATSAVGAAERPTAARYTPSPTPLPTETPKPLPALPMDDYSGGLPPDANGYSTQTVLLEDGTQTEAQTYTDASIEVAYYVQRFYSSDCHIAHIRIKDPSQLRTAISKEALGTSTSETLEIAQAKNAVIAINGEYYSQRDGSVFIIKQSQLLKSSPPKKLHQLIIDMDGNFHITTTAADNREMARRMKGNIYQAFSFGPALVVDSQPTDYRDYYFDADSPNPRTAIGQKGELEYIVCVANGRNERDEGLDMLQLAEVMAQKGCISAYNLDGGGSSAFYWKGAIQNRMNKSGKQRNISDCVYFASADPEP